MNKGNRGKVALIYARDLGGVIGMDNEIPWHIPEDLERFKELTSNGVVVMGRKTWESLPKKPLPNRLNIVFSHNQEFKDSIQDTSGGVWTASSLETVINNVGRYVGRRTIWIIGGKTLYHDAVKYADEIYVTEVQTDISAKYPDKTLVKLDVESIESDSFARAMITKPITSGDKLQFRFIRYNRIRPHF